MAPTKIATPGRKKRENVFFQPGVQGRKTGITIKDTGRRDEHGFEPLDAIFSSPEKSPPKQPTRGAPKMSSDSMDIQNSSAPEPIDVLSARRSTKGRVSLPPPKARSPIKTYLNSSPQRHPSLAPSSIARQSLGSPIRPPQLASVKRRIDFNQDIPHKSIEFSPKRPQRGGRSSDAENMPPDDDRVDSAAGSDPNTSVAQINGFAEDTYMPVLDEDSMQMLDADNEQTGVSPQLAESTPANATTDKRKSIAKGAIGSTPSSNESLKRKRGQSRKEMFEPTVRQPKMTTVDDSTVNGILPMTQLNADDTMAGALPPADEVSMEPLPAEGLSSPHKDAFDVHRDQTVEESEDSADEYSEVQPTKKSRKSVAKAQTRKKPGRPPQGSKAPKERDPNSRPKARQRSLSKAPSDDAYEGRARNSRAPSKPRSLQILRQGTPQEEPGAQKTRSGRQSIQPVAWWCGERINREFDGTIKDVIRAETVNLTPKARGKKASSRPKRGGLGAIEEEDEEQEDVEPWEEDGGILTGLVKGWDSEYNMTVEDDEVEMEIAFASNSIQTRDVMGASFSYAKLLTLPFFGAGVVDLPPGGFKRAKNSRKMQMIFFVHTGKVVVTVGELEFTISKGGAWQVPRGNFYSVENKGSKPSRIFFSQGYEHIAGDEIEGQ